MSTPNAPATVLPDGRLQIGSTVLSAAEATSLAAFIDQHRTQLDAAAAEREAVAAAVSRLADGIRASLPLPTSFGSTARGKVQATVDRPADVDAWAAHLETTAAVVTSNDGARRRREATAGALTVASDWRAATA